MANGVWLDFEMGPIFTTVLLKSACPMEFACTLSCMFGLSYCNYRFESPYLSKLVHGLLAVHQLEGCTCGSLPCPTVVLAIRIVASAPDVLGLVYGDNLARGVQPLKGLLLWFNPTMPLTLWGYIGAMQIVSCMWASHAPSASMMAMLPTKHG